MSKETIMKWNKKDCPLCWGSGLVWRGYGTRDTKCDHTWTKETVEDILATHREKLKEATNDVYKWTNALEEGVIYE